MTRGSRPGGEESRVGRILVALDASPASLAALQVAARLAAALKGELYGIYVEEETLLRGAELPITSAVGSFSGAIRQVERPELERHLRTQAAKAKLALESIAVQAQLPWSFRVARGAVAEELLRAADDADLISLGCCGWSLIESHRIGTTTQTILARADAPVLLLRRRLRMGQSVVTVYDGSEAARAALRLATSIAHDPVTPLVIVFPTTGKPADGLRLSVQSEFEVLGVNRSVRYRTVVHRDPALLEAVTQGEDTGILILPTGDIFDKGFNELLTHLECPLLVVRR